jgi:glycosyltransferase involved in cell wall biosynthesis
MAHLRQIQSLLLLGHEVAAFCRHGSVEEQTAAFGPVPPSGWRGLREFRDLDFERARDEAATTAVLIDAARRVEPDAIVVGNLHGARWPVSLLSALKNAGFRVVAFMHDGYLVSGRCAYPGGCRLYETGCDETCPTPDQYPALEPAKIPAAWRLRRKVFCGAHGVALAANSGWMLDMARRSLPDLKHSAVLYYGLDDRLFKPIDRALARRLLGVPDDRPVIVIGAVDLGDRRKGGAILRAVLAALRRKAHFLAFGRFGAELGDVQGTGFLRDFRRMPLIYSAGDIFLGTSLEEAFGQTFCEAAACGLPSVGFRVGGVPEIARHDVNARLVEAGDVDGLVAELERLLSDASARAEMGRAGRALVEAEFTLRRQGERWMEFLRALPAA